MLNLAYFSRSESKGLGVTISGVVPAKALWGKHDSDVKVDCGILSIGRKLQKITGIRQPSAFCLDFAKIGCAKALHWKLYFIDY